MALDIISDERGIKIFRKDKVSSSGNAYTTYCTKISSKKQDGSYADMFIDVLFKKGESVNNKAVIKVNHAFPVVDDYNPDNKRLKLFVLAFEVIDSGESAVAGSVDDGFMNIAMDISEEELPFN